MSSDRIKPVRPQDTYDIDAPSNQHQHEVLLWLRYIVYEAYHLTQAVSEPESPQSLTTAQVLAKINHRLECSEDPAQNEQPHRQNQ